MNWGDFYVASIGVGIGLLAVSFALGWLHAFGASEHAFGSTDHALGDHSPLPVRAFGVLFQIGLLAPFCIWFGAFGYFLSRRGAAPSWVVLLAACAAGALGAAIPRWFVRNVLAKRDHRLPHAPSPRGSLAIVTHTVRPDGTGEIQIAGQGRRWLPARSADRRRLDRGAEVVVIDYVRGVAEVALLDDDGQDPVVRRPLVPSDQKRT
jgi:hypothetical protein